MDPITSAIILAASKLGETVVKDAYQGLKALIERKFGSGSDLTRAVEAVESKPESAGRQQTLSEELTTARAGSDQEILQAIAALQAALEALAEKEGGGGGTRTVIRQQAGDNATQIGQVKGNVTFGPK